MTRTNIFRVDIPQDKWCREAFVQTSWPTAHWRRRSAVGDFAAVFTWQVWDMGEPRKDFFFFLEVGRGESQWPAKKTQRWTFAYSEGFAVTERAGKCIDISVHLSVCLRWGSYPEEGPSLSKWLLPNLDLLPRLCFWVADLGIQLLAWHRHLASYKHLKLTLSQRNMHLPAPTRNIFPPLSHPHSRQWHHHPSKCSSQNQHYHLRYSPSSHSSPTSNLSARSPGLPPKHFSAVSFSP